MMEPYYILKCPVQNYDWGNPSPDSVIANFLIESGQKSKTELQGPFAELWMGAHPKAPSLLCKAESGSTQASLATAGMEISTLDKAIRDNPKHFLGKRLAEKSETLPFLFKILDANRPLSIQAHPDQKLAKILHEKDPQNYPDDNHKPELAIALSPMKALIGFRSPAEIQYYLNLYSEIDELTDPEGKLPAFLNKPEDSTTSETTDMDNVIMNAVSQQDRETLKARYENLMNCDADTIRKAVKSILTKIIIIAGPEKGNPWNFDTEQTGPDPAETEKLFQRLLDLYGSADPGVFSPFFMNIQNLLPGQALYLGANEPHAYLEGQIIECMAASDNVVRAGLTQKFVDTATLVSMLHYQMGLHEVLIAEPEESWKIYRTDAHDFSVRKPNGLPAVLPADRPVILLILKGTIKLRIESAGQDEAKAEQIDHVAPAVYFFPGDRAERNIKITLDVADKSFGGPEHREQRPLSGNKGPEMVEVFLATTDL